MRDVLRAAVARALANRLLLSALVVLSGVSLIGQVATPQPPIPLATIVVSSSSPTATDDGNPTGTAFRPRKTIPNPVPAGSLVELSGTYNTPQTSPNTLQFQGTITAPIVVRSTAGFARAEITAPWETSGSYYTIEDLKFESGAIAVAPNDHATFRSNEFSGTKALCGGFGIQSFVDGMWNRNVTLYHSWIHDNGDVNATFDQDCHGIAIGHRSEGIFIRENVLERNSGDGLQINGTPDGRATTRMIFVEGNVSAGNRQTGFWTKQATDVVFIRNKAHDHRPHAGSSLGPCMGGQYGPELVWFIENEVWNCDYGIQLASDSGDGHDGVSQLFLNNSIHDIHDSNNTAATAGIWRDSAISLMGGTNRYVLSNRIANVDAGVTSGPTGRTYADGNTASGVAAAFTLGPLTPLPSTYLQTLQTYFKSRYLAWQ